MTGPKWSRRPPSAHRPGVLAGVPGRDPAGLTGSVFGPGDWPAAQDMATAMARGAGDPDAPGWAPADDPEAFPGQDRWRRGRVTAGIPGAQHGGTVRHPDGQPVAWQSEGTERS